MTVDVALVGGRVLDPANGVDRVTEVAISNGAVAAVGDGAGADALQTIDVAGALVTPGLVDLHTHVFSGGGYWGLSPDPIAWCTGVTTWVDAGSAGAYSMPALDRQVRGLESRVHALLNISAVGLTGRTGESVNIDNCDVESALTAIAAHSHLIRGIKVRMDTHTVGENGLEPLRRALEVGDAAGLPVMVHIGYGPPLVSDIAALLRPGDIITHCASGVADGLRETDGTLAPALREAHERGVVFDVGHGSGGFSYEVLDALLAAGVQPRTVSSDLHARCVHGPAFDLPTTLGTLMAAGLGLEQVIAAATVEPARVLGLPAGTLTVGSPADVAVFDLVEGEHSFGDAHGVVRTGSLRLANRLTLRAGRPMTPRFPEPVPSWIPLNSAQRRALAAREQALRELLGTPLVAIEQLDEQFPRRHEETDHDPC